MKTLMLLLLLIPFPAFAQDIPIHATWTDTSSNEDYFEMARKCRSHYEQYLVDFAPLPPQIPANQTSQDFTHPTDSECTWRIHACNSVGCSAPSNEVITTTIVPPATVPSAPGTLNVTGVPLAASDAVTGAGMRIVALKDKATLLKNALAIKKAKEAEAKNKTTLTLVNAAEALIGK